MAVPTGSTTSCFFILPAIGKSIASGRKFHDRAPLATPLKGLSRMRWKSHVRFLGGGRGRKALLLPDLSEILGDPELRHLSSGQPVVSFSIATDETYTDKHGQKQELVE
jgi:Single-strand binding protein family